MGDLIGLPILDDYDVTLGHVQKVVRTPEGKIRLIVSYSRWFGWFGRPVAVPIEVVVILGRQINSVDIQPEEYEKAPTWSAGNDQTIPDNGDHPFRARSAASGDAIYLPARRLSATSA